MTEEERKCSKCGAPMESGKSMDDIFTIWMCTKCKNREMGEFTLPGLGHWKEKKE